LRRDVTWRDVEGFSLSLHESQKSGRRSLKLRYYSGPDIFDDWLALEHPGHAREMAIEKWQSLGGQLPAPRTIEEAIQRQRELCKAIQIYLQRDGQYHNVIGRRPQPLSAPQAGAGR
jgi:hypothetical protein